MKLSDNGVRLLAEWEGLRLHPYRDAGGKLTIGIGHLITKEELIGAKFDDGLTKEEALALLAVDVKPAEQAVRGCIEAPLQQHEFDALAIFAFNIGSSAFRKSTLRKKLNAGDYVSVPSELRKWVRAGGKRCQGLANRREKEIALWRGKL